MILKKHATAGVILAGGRSRRMGGGDKSLRPLAGVPMLGHVARRLAPQVGILAISANGDLTRFDAFALPVLPDAATEGSIGSTGGIGPLAGILAGLDWAAAQPGCRWLVTSAADTPFLPTDLVIRLHEARVAAGAEVALARSDGRSHPVVGLWPVALAVDLRAALAAGTRKAAAWAQRHRLAATDWPGGPADPFFNVNTPGDLAEAERRLAAAEAG